MAKLNLESDVTGSVWKILVQVGDQVNEDDTLMILESMKMEIPVSSTDSGTVSAIHIKEGDAVSEGQVIVTLEA